jgi:hypothetical protein
VTAERSALNTLQHLSGIATPTRRYVDVIAGTRCDSCSTRARPFPAFVRWRNMLRGWVGPRTTACGSTTGC